MNIFFYSPRRTTCPVDCAYPDCAERSLYTLRALPALSSMQQLPSGSLFPLSPQSQLRGGDLIIIHVASHLELEVLVEKSQAFEHYRLILIVSSDVYDTSRRYHLLNPRYIATQKQAVDNLETVVSRMITPADHLSSSTT